MVSEVERVLYQVLHHVNRALDAIAVEAQLVVNPELTLALERLRMAKALWTSKDKPR